MPSFLLLLPPSLLWLLATVDGAKGAECLGSTNWGPLATQDGSPCTVAALVGGLCSETLILNPRTAFARSYPLPGQQPDSTGTAIPRNNCTCTIAVYNLVSACAFCQSQDPSIAPNLYRQTISAWKGSCEPNGVPFTNSPPSADSATIPPWALRNADFNGDAAAANPTAVPDDAPQTGATQTGTEQPIPIPIDSSIGVPAASSTPLDANASASSSISTGAIVGIVVAVVAIIALAVIAFLVWRRVNRQKTAPSSEFMQYSRAPVMSIDEHAPYDPPPAFTPGHFQDPIFEKGIAIANANAASAPASSPTGTQAQTPPSLETSPLNVEATSSGWRVKEEEIGFTK